MASGSLSPDIEAYRLMQAGRLEEALGFAQRATTGQRACVPAHGLLATILLQLGRAAEAEAVVTAALKCQPGTGDAYDALAHVSLLLGQHERSNALYRRVVEIEPGSARFWYNLASSERSLGRLGDAEAACDRAISLDRTHYASYILRSELRVQTPASNHVEELKARLTTTQPGDRARVVLGYALAKELDDLHRFDEAFNAFHDAAGARRRHLDYDVAVDERKLQRIAETFPARLADHGTGGVDSGRYVFIVGLPRSGTTLLERILTNLPGVRSNGETDHFSRSLLAASPPASANPHGARDVFERAAAGDPVEVAARYAKLADHGGPALRVIEKLPMNYLYLGAIRRALPKATVILVRRSPVDSCFAMYRTLFDQAYPFTYDFEDLARYYAAYERLIAHWRTVLGGDLHEIVYEDLVREPSRVGAAAAQACGIAWRDSATEVQKNASASFTASAAQIRRPIYASSSGRWRHYRPHLEPLIRALRRCGVALDDE